MSIKSLALGVCVLMMLLIVFSSGCLNSTEKEEMELSWSVIAVQNNCNVELKLYVYANDSYVGYTYLSPGEKDWLHIGHTYSEGHPVKVRLQTYYQYTNPHDGTFYIETLARFYLHADGEITCEQP